jgi:hypothetical protein
LTDLLQQIKDQDYISLDLDTKAIILDDASLIEKCDVAKQEYMTMINDLHNILQSQEDLTHDEKLEYCNSERYFMKMYLRNAIIKINKCFPD